MAISDKERREVAHRLRADWMMFRRMGTERVSLFTMRCMDQILRDIGLTPERCDWQTIVLRLASLIDRPTCRNFSPKPADVLLCSECGEHVDIAYVESCDDYHAKYCPHCGAEVVVE